MLVVDINVNGRHSIGNIKIVRGDPHKKLPNHFEYHYEARDESMIYIGKVLHNFNLGPFALLQKVTKSITHQQKSAKANMVGKAVR